MSRSGASRTRRSFQAPQALLAPEVIQTSAMDCGPAALKCLLEGFGIPVSYSRLQDACQTDLDGTSINTIEQIANALGLEAEQIMIPIDHILLGSAHALPALVVVRRDNMTHFLVAWRQHGPLIQLMDPARGRRWLREPALRAELYIHSQRVSASAWREWAGTDEFLQSVDERLHALGIRKTVRDALLRIGISDSGWLGLATLDASTRMIADLASAGGVRKGPDAGRMLLTIAARVSEGANPYGLIPAPYWSTHPKSTDRTNAQQESDAVTLNGAVLLRVRRRMDQPAPSKDDLTSAGSALPKSVVRALDEPPSRPFAEVWRLVRHDGIWAPGLLSLALLMAAGGAVFEMLMFRSLLEIGNLLSVRSSRVVAVALLAAFVGMLLWLDVGLSEGLLRIGRRVEARLRAALLDKIPRLGDRYFSGRLVSDMAHRAHDLDALRALPELGGRLARSSMQLLLTAVGLAWLDPPSGWIAFSGAALALAIPLGTSRLLAERELRQRSHSAALSRYYLDSLLGLTAARTHGAERALARRHESQLVEWGRSSLHWLRGGVVVEGLQLLVGSVLATWLVLDFAGRGGRPGGTLLLVYWALSLPLLGREVASSIRRFPAYRNIVARALELLDAPEETRETVEEAEDVSASAIETTEEISLKPARPMMELALPRRGVELRLRGIHVRLAGNSVLEAVDLKIGSGEHVAVVGHSGAGKSTLAGLLLGWYTPSAGQLLVDGLPAQVKLAELRRATAWVDPGVHLWNRSLFDNLRYSDPGAVIANIGVVIEQAGLTEILEKLPAGLQSRLGEGGGLTSGGEGQRVRFGRSLVQQGVRLAVLDEPFRGLDRAQRSQLLARALELWRDATLLCITHDIEETLSFPRVIVIEKGRVVEDDKPSILSQAPNSVYASLLAAERAVRSELWTGDGWKLWRLTDGGLTEETRKNTLETEAGWTIRHGFGGQSGS